MKYMTRMLKQMISFFQLMLKKMFIPYPRQIHYFLQFSKAEDVCISAYILLFWLCGNMWRECKDPLTMVCSKMQHKIHDFCVSHKCHFEKSEKRSPLKFHFFQTFHSYLSLPLYKFLLRT